MRLVHVFSRCIERLYLGWNQFGLKGARAIAEGLKNNSSIKELSLPWAGLGDKGSRCIAYMLDTNTSVKSLDISGNSLSGSTCMVLREAVKGKYLEELTVRDNIIGTYGARQLLQLVKSGELRNQNCFKDEDIAVKND